MQQQRIQNKELRQSIADTSLNEKQLQRVADFIGDKVGIQLSMDKQKLVEGRLRRRLTALKLPDFESYLNHTLDSYEGENEQLQLVDVITTNKTHFYREPQHFDYLESTAIVEMEKMLTTESRESLNFWSAGCSSGEEPYTLSIILNELRAKRRSFNFNILATDISHSCLTTANRGVYTERQAEAIPLELRKKYLLRSRNSADDLVQMGEALRKTVQFESLNLMDKQFNVAQKMDAIFCRNVMIYFNNKLREELVERFENQLVKGGYLFVGHSESLNGHEHNLKQVSPMVYRKL